jgi:type IV secretory pathway VirB6-like protein
VRGEIERLTGRMNYLNQSVEMSTISVSASEPAPISGQGWGITDALSEAVTGFIDSVNGIIIFVGVILPVVIFIAVVYFIALGIKRKILPKLKT